jgi:hypothetical protein
LRDEFCAVHDRRREWDRDATIGARHDIGREYADESVKVSPTSGIEEGVNDGPVTDRFDGSGRCGGSNPTASSTRELPSRRYGALNYGGDLVEGEPERIVEHKRDSLRSSENS